MNRLYEKEGRKFLRNKMKKILSDSGFSIEWVESNSFWDLEYQLSLSHYKLYDGTEKWGSNDKLREEENIRYLMGL